MHACIWLLPASAWAWGPYIPWSSLSPPGCTAASPRVLINSTPSPGTTKLFQSAVYRSHPCFSPAPAPYTSTSPLLDGNLFLSLSLTSILMTTGYMVHPRSPSLTSQQCSMQFWFSWQASPSPPLPLGISILAGFLISVVNLAQSLSTSFSLPFAQVLPCPSPLFSRGSSTSRLQPQMKDDQQRVTSYPNHS